MDWSIKITKADNGFICEYEEEEIGIKREVFEELETDDGEMEAMRYMLLFVKEHFGMHYSKHSKKNLVINIEGEDEDD